MSAELRGFRTNTTAIAALGAALLGFACFWGIGGLVAVVLGIAALKEIERSEGRERGRGLSIAAIALGGLNLASLVVGTGVAIALLARPSAPPPHVARPALPAPARSAPVPRPGGKPSPEMHPEAATPLAGIHETRIGRLRVVDVVGHSGSLTGVLDGQHQASREAGEKLVVFVVAGNCLPCNGVSLGLPDRRMQAALAGVRLVRVDALEHGAELLRLGIPIESIPGFALLGEGLRPVDYVHGGEWDADIPENIAPVLRAFVRGTYLRRRHPFRGPERPDETAL